ncbi:MAG: MBL fold metallo-hydrolase [bacterium]|nr:MBL fold metallo-hydrolase [bacterium]
MKPYLILLFFLFLLWGNGVVWAEVIEGREAKVVFFDIGQGDAVFLRTSHGHRILIDGGPDDTLVQKLFQELPFWSRRIDAIILTHPHADHVAGFFPILEQFDISLILWSGVRYDSSFARQWEKLVKENGENVIIAKFPLRILWNTFSQDFLDVLHPFESLEGQSLKDVDKSSLVLRASISERKFLFTGDLFRDGEQKLVERGFNLRSDILHVGHHGSRTSTDPLFVEAVAPAIAVIQMGRENRFGHPHQETIATLERYGITILRTDREGDIDFHIVR